MIVYEHDERTASGGSISVGVSDIDEDIKAVATYLYDGETVTAIDVYNHGKKYHVPVYDGGLEQALHRAEFIATLCELEAASNKGVI